jgi:hypothetical protein
MRVLPRGGASLGALEVNLWREMPGPLPDRRLRLLRASKGEILQPEDTGEQSWPATQMAIRQGPAVR